MTTIHTNTQHHTEDLTIINRVAQALNGSVDLNQALQTTLAHVADLLGLETGWIWLLNEQSGDAYLAASQNLPPALVENPLRMEGSCYCLETYQRGDMAGAANINVVSCSRLSDLVGPDNASLTHGLQYHASIPLYVNSAVKLNTSTLPDTSPPANISLPEMTAQKKQRTKLGVLNVASSDWRELSPADLRLLHTVGDMLAIAIERARLYERSQELGAVNERNRLAREIHDTLAQGFTAITLQLETVEAVLEMILDEEEGDEESILTYETLEQLHRAVGQSLTIAQSNLDEARRSVHDLRAAPLEGNTLAIALRTLAHDAARRENFELSVQIIGGGIPLPTAVETGLYRIAQEAISNICHHAQAKQVEVRLMATLQEVQLTIRDDGVGFEQDKLSTQRYGLAGMNERAHLLRGTLTVESAVGDGSQIMVHVPLGVE